MGYSQRSVGTRCVVRVRNVSWTRCGDVRQGSSWDLEEAPMEVTLALTTGPAKLHQVVRKAVVLRRGVENQGPQATAAES